MTTSPEQFRACLANAYARRALGFDLSDSEAQRIASDSNLLRGYYDNWVASQPVSEARVSAANPIGANRAEANTALATGLEYAPPPGWYADPKGTPRTRWWNGAEWTEHFLSGAPIPQSAPVETPRLQVSPEQTGSDLTFGQAISTVFAKYAEFNDLARRSEYWWWYLFVSLVSLGTVLIDAVATAGFLSVLWLLVTITPSLAVMVRRLRDAGYAWPVIFLMLVPFGGIVVIVLLCRPTDDRWRRVKEKSKEFGLPEYPRLR